MPLDVMTMALLLFALIAMLVWINHLTKSLDELIDAHNRLVDAIVEAAEETQ